MLGLEIVLQILGIVALILFIYVLGYVLYLLRKVDTKLDSVLELISYYEKFKVVVTDFMEGPGRKYLDIAKMVLSFVSPLLTRSRKAK
jgi:flagellar basal body-associated protein FliL